MSFTDYLFYFLFAGVGGGGAYMHFLDRFFEGSDFPRFGKGGGRVGEGAEFLGPCFLQKTPSWGIKIRHIVLAYFSYLPTEQ